VGGQVGARDRTGSGLLLPAGRSPAAAEAGAGLGEDAVHEPVRAARGLGEGPDALPLVILLAQIGSELVALRAGDPRALLEVCHVRPSVAVRVLSLPPGGGLPLGQQGAGRAATT